MIEKQERNRKIYEEKEAGKSYDYLAKKYKLHSGRIYQIVARERRARAGK